MAGDPLCVAKGARVPAVPGEEVVNPDGFREAGREQGTLVVAAEPFTGRRAAARAGDSCGIPLVLGPSPINL